jgi:GTP-binding protein
MACPYSNIYFAITACLWGKKDKTKNMIIKSAEFIKSATNSSQYPEHDLYEIAFAGRSNVGKSSVINTLLNRKKLVKTSRTPGRTQLLNFFEINKEFCFTDLPGYGYAKVPLKVKKNWGEMIEDYLVLRKNLRALVLIMDIRRKVPTSEEQNFISWLKLESIPCILILTKADKLSKSKQRDAFFSYSKKLLEDKDNIILFSAKSRLGKDALWSAIEKFLI